MARSVEVKFLGDASSLTRAFGQASRSAGSFSSAHPGLARGMKMVGTAALGLAGVVGGGLAVALKQGVQSLKEHELADAQTAAAIKSTGGAAQVTAGQIREHANALEDLTGIDDVAIQKGQNLLLTFTNIRNEAGAGNDIFTQTTDIMLDMATAMGTDTSSAAMTLGKALNDPVTGMGKLARAGVTFTDAQKEAIKAMVESGDVMGAQKLILEELRKEFGGSAEAAGNTFAGSINKLKNKFEEFGEKLASKVMPYAQRFVEFLTKLLDAGSAGEALSILGDALGGLARKFGDWVGEVDWGKIATRLGEGLGRAVRAINWGEVASITGDVFEGLGEGLMAAFTEPVGRAYVWVLEKTQGMISAIGDAVRALADLPGDFGLFEGAADSLDRAEERLGNFTQGIREQLIPGLDEAQEHQAAWADAVEETGQTTSDLVAGTAELRTIYRTMGLEGLAKRLLGVKEKISLADAATLAWAAAFGEVPDKSEVEAVLKDKDARAALEAWLRELNEHPENIATLVQALGTKEAKRLLGDVTSAAKETDRQKPKVKTSAPGAKDTKVKLDDVTSAAKDIPPSRKTRVTQTGAGAVEQAASLVAQAIGAIDTWVNVVFSSSGSVNPPGPGAQHGRTNWGGGALLVGEAGPEIVNLPRGSDVLTNAESRRVLAARGRGGASAVAPIIINVHGSIHSDRDLADIVRRELAELGRRNLTTGLT